MTRLTELREARRWKKTRLILELKKAAQARGELIAQDSSLDRMIREWEAGRRPLVGTYLELFCDVYCCSPAELGTLPDDVPAEVETDEAAMFRRELFAATSADMELVKLFEAQTDNIRQLDRRLGASALLPQSRAHVEQMENLLRHGVFRGTRELIAGALTGAAALAGWQTLDLGQYREAWKFYEIGKSAAREAENPTVLAHVTAEQAYVLIDLGNIEDAVAMMKQARERAGSSIPSLMRTWLYAAEAEAHAAMGDDAPCRRALDAADAELPEDAQDPELPFLFLAGSHLARWRGNCLARLGADEAITDLTHALDTMEAGFTRAEAGLRCDLATALRMRGEMGESRQQAEHAKQLAALAGSARQRRRIDGLLREAG
ncbi:hypothetical protein [Streptomyces violascens]|uniref:hypothetical protein n=1 Tax=Streptomyces violascens TaxID=67381 RepID=UPI003680DAA6